MEKQALKTDLGTVGRFAAGGLITGGGTAALLNLIHMLREQRKEQLDKSQGEETDKDTIVLNLPAKIGAYTKKVAYNLTTKSMVSAKATKVDKKTKAGGRKPEGDKGGQFDNPVKVTDAENAPQDIEPKSESKSESESESTKTATGWPTLTLSALAAIGGTGAGVALVDKLYQMKREKQLKNELEAVQQQYLTTLTGKKASALDTLFPIVNEKQADATHTFGMLNYPLAAAALLTLMGAGGTAYITKRILDEKLRESRERGLDLPKVKRIVFRTAPSAGGMPEELPEDMQKASEQDIMNVKAALFIMMDKLDTHTRVLDTPEVKQAQAAAGMPTRSLFQLSQGDIASLMDALNRNPELAKLIVRKGMSTRPIMKHFQWLANTTPGLAMGKHKILDYLNKFKAPEAVQPKMASITDLAAAMMIGKGLGSEAGDVAKSVLKADDPGIEEPPINVSGKPKIDLSQVKVTAADPAAAAYVKANKQKIIKLLQTLADEGKI